MQGNVKAKKYLGQHFLKNETIASSIVDALTLHCPTQDILEIGPGTGVLTKYLLTSKEYSISAMEVDAESVTYLNKKYPELTPRLYLQDFLTSNLPVLFTQKFCVIGNFPYHISSQIIFKIIDNRTHIPIVVGMFQKEVAERLCAPPHTKAYGILSVLTQAFYETSYLFTVGEQEFIPPPKVKSGVIRMKRKEADPDVSYKDFAAVVKMAFNQRRKKLRNAIKAFGVDDIHLSQSDFANRRAEELSLDDFISLTKLIQTHGKNYH